MYEELQELYRQSGEKVRAESMKEDEARAYYGDYIKFIQSVAPEKGCLLDVGCGNGWSSYLLSRCDYKTVGVDLNADAFDPRDNDNLTLKEASAMELPFADATFDIVAANQTLEHIPDPRRALNEMLRVLKPNGIICVVGPNLLSIGHPIKIILIYAWQNRPPLRRVFYRDANMSKHPFGNTVFEAARMLAANVFRVTAKMLAHETTFEMRDPDLTPPFHADNDACYLCNPIDLRKFFASRHCKIIQNGKPNRLPGTSLLAAGTWIAAIKLP